MQLLWRLNSLTSFSKSNTGFSHQFTTCPCLSRHFGFPFCSLPLTVQGTSCSLCDFWYGGVSWCQCRSFWIQAIAMWMVSLELPESFHSIKTSIRPDHGMIPFSCFSFKVLVLLSHCHGHWHIMEQLFNVKPLTMQSVYFFQLKLISKQFEGRTLFRFINNSSAPCSWLARAR